MEVTYNEKRIGHIDWNPDHWGANVSLRCAIPGDTLQLLRCYAVTKEGLLLIGLPEPRGGQLVLTRHLSTEVLRNAGCDSAPPTVFFLSDATAPVVPPAQQERPDSPIAESSSDTPKPSDKMIDEAKLAVSASSAPPMAPAFPASSVSVASSESPAPSTAPASPASSVSVALSASLAPSTAPAFPASSVSVAPSASPAPSTAPAFPASSVSVAPSASPAPPTAPASSASSVSVAPSASPAPSTAPAFPASSVSVAPSASPAPPTAPTSSASSAPPASSTLSLSSGLCTGDSILDQLITQQCVVAAQEQDTIVLTCSFAPDLPFALAPAFVLCEIEDGQATLRYDKTTAVSPKETAVTESDVSDPSSVSPASDVIEQYS